VGRYSRTRTEIEEAIILNDLCLEGFLTDSLALWRVSGAVERGELPVVAIIRADNGAIVWIERPADKDTPFRWAVRWRVAGDAPGGAREQRPRHCASLVGVLKALRSALDVDRGSPVRIAPAPADA